MTFDLPAVTEPSKPPRVEVEVAPTMTDEELNAVLQRAGNTKVSVRMLQQMSSLGIRIKGLGVIPLQRAGVLIDQEKCDELLDMIRVAAASRVADGEKRGAINDLTKLAQAFAYLMKGKTEIRRLSLEIEQAVAPAGAPVNDNTPAAPPNFVPGRPIVPRAGGTTIITKEVHISEAGKPPSS